MSWRVFLPDRPQIPGIKPLRLAWSAIGGPRQALLSLENEPVGFEEMRSWLGSRVEIYDPSDRLAWWGYMDSVSQPVGMTAVQACLEDMANRVAVRYRSMEPGKDFGATVQTNWKEDLTSQAIYGVKEAILKRDLMSEEHALLLRDVSLCRMAHPSARLLSTHNAKQSQVLCRGWFERLSWHQWPAHTDVRGHSPSQQGFQSMGASITQKSLAQSCIFSEAVKVTSASVRIRKIGQPGDQICVQLQTDALGRPSGVVRAEAVLAASALPTESYSWLSVWFAEPCSVAAGERIWLVVTRDGAVSSTAYYSLGLDENLGFPDGKLLLLDTSNSQWKARSPDADLLFKLTTLSDSVDLMAQIVQKVGFLSGFSYEAGQGYNLPYVSEPGANCRAALLALLSIGMPDMNNLLVDVDAKLRLRVFPQPKPGSSRYWLGRDGRIKNETGKDLEPAWQAVGNWLTSETATTCFLENLILENSEGIFQLGTDRAM